MSHDDVLIEVNKEAVFCHAVYLMFSMGPVLLGGASLGLTFHVKEGEKTAKIR